MDRPHPLSVAHAYLGEAAYPPEGLSCRTMSRHLLAAVIRVAAPAVLSIATLLALALVRDPRLGLPLLGLAILASLAIHRHPKAGTDLPSRVILAAGVVAFAAGELPVLPVVIAGGLLLTLLLAEPVLHRLTRSWYQSTRLPVRPSLPARLVDNGGAWLANSTAVFGTGLLAALPLPAWWLVVPGVLAASHTGWLLADGLHRWRTAHRDELAALTRAIEAHRPVFLLYFSAPPGSEYQARMWLPYLAELGEPFLVVTPEAHNLAPLSAHTGAPVVAYDTFEALDAIMVPSLRAAFYVNNGMQNTHCVRFTRLTHVQLYHGDSDKAVTASPVNQLYDRVFVAGQAAVDRFAAHGVQIAPERFRIVGRPQAAQLEVVEAPISQVRNPVVLYAPTWVGAHADVNYCSLPVAERIVEALLARGATVILRPHPYSERHRESAATLRRLEQLLARDGQKYGRPHRFGQAATVERDLFACMNESDAMICDVSSVASEYLYTGKPFAITDMTGQGADFPREFPVARAAYVLDGDTSNLREVLEDLLERDPLRATRHQLRTYYLGDFPPERYRQAFFDQARDCLRNPVTSGV
jgi:hypothetical protein